MVVFWEILERILWSSFIEQETQIIAAVSKEAVILRLVSKLLIMKHDVVLQSISFTREPWGGKGSCRAVERNLADISASLAALIDLYARDTEYCLAA